MTTNQTQTQNPDPAVEPSAAIEPKPQTSRTRTRKPKPNAVDYSLSTTGLTLYPRYTGSIPQTLAAKYPEFLTLSNRLGSYGFGPVKFFFTYAVNAAKPNKKTGDQFYFTPNVKTAKTPKIDADLYKSNRHKISGKQFFKLFPELKPLFVRFAKLGHAAITLNVSYAVKPNTRREQIIRSTSAADDIE